MGELPTTESMAGGFQSPGEREVTAPQAFFASLLGFGYVYVGRIGAAIALIAVTLGLLAAFSWTRAILTGSGLSTLVLLELTAVTVQLVHPTVIAARAKPGPPKAYNRWWFYLVWIVVGGGLTDALIGDRDVVFGYETYKIPSAAMSPTIEPGDQVITDAWRYHHRSPAVGDIVVFDMSDGTRQVKRVVGVPGDRIELRGRDVYRNDAALVEPYLHDPESGFSPPDVGPLGLGADEVFVLGDFRENSRDSRFFGPIRVGQIRGRVELRYFSYSHGIRWERFPAQLGE